ncbi:MAG TPA: DinB family protein [Chryseolinea sp.]|nr:DinB family protein [Chryseolinea sp.]
MKNTVQELDNIIDQFRNKINEISDADFTAKPLPNKWSKKEVLGHLIDSAHNNLRRFICGQYETTPSKIVYDQDFWVKANGYQSAKKEDVIQFWVLMNSQICSVLMEMNELNYLKVSDTGKTEVKFNSLQFLAEDYVRHLKHHLNQIIPGSFDIVYS